MLVQAMPYPAGGGGITLGNAVRTRDDNTLANWMVGSAQQAAASGTINFLSIQGGDTETTAVNFRLVVYAATNETNRTWGAKLAETAVTNGLGPGETKKLALLAPLSVTAGNWYALAVHCGGALHFSTDGSGALNRGTYFSDSFADGSPATGVAGSNFGPRPVIFGTTA
jgi:hypothetical protein